MLLGQCGTTSTLQTKVFTTVTASGLAVRAKCNLAPRARRVGGTVGTQKSLTLLTAENNSFAVETSLTEHLTTIVTLILVSALNTVRATEKSLAAFAEPEVLTRCTIMQFALIAELNVFTMQAVRMIGRSTIFTMQYLST